MAVVFVLGRVLITAFLSFKYFMQGLINFLYIKILDAKTNIPLSNENCPRHIFSYSPNPL